MKIMYGDTLSREMVHSNGRCSSNTGPHRQVNVELCLELQLPHTKAGQVRVNSGASQDRHDRAAAERAPWNHNR